MKKHLDIQVKGKVQGVFFRAHTRETAQHYGLTGFVCNRPDGSVYIEAEGDTLTLDKFIEWCHKGSPQSSVEEVIIKENELQDYHSFDIRHD